MSRIVIALGGNALQKADEAATAENQIKNIQQTAVHLVEMIKNGHDVVLAHGNGPQVGRIVQQNDFASEITPAMPFDVCSAMSQGMIGYHIQQCIGNLLNKEKIDKQVASIVTQVVVDKDDPKFQSPSKPIGKFYTEEEAARIMSENPDFVFKEDANRGWRRVVASPLPNDITEIDVVRTLLDNNFVTVTVGGGGIPVVRKEDGELEGVSAVIDKDFAAELLAEKLDADVLMILTAVDHVFINYGKADQEELKSINSDQAREYISQSQFAAGSMLPKIEAAIKFADSKMGRRCIITSLENASKALNESYGTIVTNTSYN